MSFSIPGQFISSPAGNYTMELVSEEPCEEIEILFFDSYGDGWDAGYMSIFNSEGELVFWESLSSGSTPDPGFGWQNEFYVYEIPTSDFAWNNPEVNLNEIEKICFQFAADSSSSPTGAIAIDDIVLSQSGSWGSSVSISSPDSPISETVSIYPNPARNNVSIEFQVNSYSNLKIIDVTGRIVFTTSIQLGSDRIELELSKFSIGLYSVILSSRENWDSGLMIIVK
jgi:hypothetical protein